MRITRCVCHDITFETSSFTTAKLLAPNLAPLPVARIRDDLKNLRTASLELDSLYGPPAPRDPANHDRMLIGKVTRLNGTAPPLKRPPGKGDDNDLPREPRNADALRDRAARIGDPRNDENLIVAQLHLAFLKAHNRLVDQGRGFEEARRLVRQHYFGNSGFQTTPRMDSLPVYCMFVTDGQSNDEGHTRDQIQSSSYEPLFWQFVGMGQSNYGVLERFDTMAGRRVDNVGFFAVDDIATLSDAELYDRLLTEFPSWLKAARAAGILR